MSYDFMPYTNGYDLSGVSEAINLIVKGLAKRVDLGNYVVYQCGKIIRIDIKGLIKE